MQKFICMKRFSIILILFCTHIITFSQTDSIGITEEPVKKTNLFQKVYNYFADVDSDTKNLDKKGVSWSFIGGPYYSSDVKFSIAATGTASYKLKGCDSETQPSFASVYATISTAGFWSVGVDGTTFFKEDKQRINYSMSFGHSPRDYWGIGYNNAIQDELKTNLQQTEAKIHAEYVYSFVPNLYIGPAIEWNHNLAKDMDKPELLNHQDNKVNNYGAGVVVQYDTRDLVTNAYSGVYAHFNTMFNPKFLGNKYYYTMIDFTASYYHTAWRNAVIAAQINSKFNFGNVSWAMMSLYGGNQVMRGYYLGRYRDKHMVSTQVELRQRVYKRSGLVLWGGVGTVFHDADSFGNRFLPNYGVGYRFEFRKRMNIRLDWGFGAHGQSGIIFSMNEAF